MKDHHPLYAQLLPEPEDPEPEDPEPEDPEPEDPEPDEPEPDDPEPEEPEPELLDELEVAAQFVVSVDVEIELP